MANKEDLKAKKIQKSKDKNIYIDKVECVECGSLETNANGLGVAIFSGGLAIFTSCLIAFSCCLWIPILGWILLIPFGMGALFGLCVMPIGLCIIPFTKNFTMNCRSCGSKYKVDAKEYKRQAKNKITKII